MDATAETMRIRDLPEAKREDGGRCATVILVLNSMSCDDRPSGNKGTTVQIQMHSQRRRAMVGSCAGLDSKRVQSEVRSPLSAGEWPYKCSDTNNLAPRSALRASPY